MTSPLTFIPIVYKKTFHLDPKGWVAFPCPSCERVQPFMLSDNIRTEEVYCIVIKQKTVYEIITCEFCGTSLALEKGTSLPSDFSWRPSEGLQFLSAEGYGHWTYWESDLVPEDPTCGRHHFTSPTWVVGPGPFRIGRVSYSAPSQPGGWHILRIEITDVANSRYSGFQSRCWGVSVSSFEACNSVDIMAVSGPIAVPETTWGHIKTVYR